MKKVTTLHSLITVALLLVTSGLAAQSFTMAEVINYPFPRDMTSAATGSKIAYTVQEQGKRNIYVASGPDFTIRKLTNYTKDDGQELSSVSISKDGKWVVYVRGGEHSGNRDRSVIVNPANDPIEPKIQVWSVPFIGGAPKLLSEGDYAVISPKSDKVAFLKDGQVWVAPITGITKSKSLFGVKGECSDLQWSPDGSQLAFVCNRTDHAFIGIYTNDNTEIKWISPSFSRDASVRWSPDGKKVAFIRTPGNPPQTNAATAPAAPTQQAGRRGITAAAQTPTAGGSGRPQQTWAIWTADVATGKGEPLWKAPETARGSYPGTDGGANLNWAANRIVFLSSMDGWPHLYSIKPEGSEPLLLTPGEFMAEEIKMTSDGKYMIFAGNTGPDTQLDIDRRHIVRVSVDKQNMEVLTPGIDMETYPTLTGDGLTLAMFSASAQRPLVAAVMPLNTRKVKLVGEKLLDPKFPVKQMVIPKQAIYTSPDGQKVHAQLFEPVGGPVKKPAIVYIHGGPQRQMLLGWHHMDYYSIDYALNQYLANMGFVVLSVNYRQGIGYGYEFNRPTATGANYIDVKAGGEWLAAQPFVDTARLGVYGGSAGGALTATALARDSKLFKAGVIIHGNSPEALDKWTSPTMIVHGDDDRNVAFSAGVSLIRRFELQGNPYFEFLAIPGDSHHWMKHANILTVNTAVVDFLKKQLLMKKTMASN